MKGIYTLAIAVMAVIGLALFATPASAVHKGSGQLVCGQCHTMHNSQGSVEFVVAGAQEKLLRASGAQIHELCLSCHSSGGSGDQAWANSIGQPSVWPPKVWREAQTWAAGTNPFNTLIGAGGDFYNTGSVTAGGAVTLAGGDVQAGPSLGYGHSLGVTATVPPGADSATGITLTCTNCHDPHGSLVQPTSSAAQGINVFRMLKVMPVGGGGGTALEAAGVVFNNGGTSSIVSYTGAASHSASGNLAANLSGENPTATTHVWPVYFSSSHNIYGAGTSDTATGIAGMSGWCAQCHDNWHEDLATGNNYGTVDGNDWTRHPVDVDMDTTTGAATPYTTDQGLVGGAAGGSGTAIYDRAHYTTTVTLANSKVPMAQAEVPALGDYDNGGAGDFYYGDSAGDRVFCLSCHFAHAGPYFDALKWDHTSAVSSGSQTGSSLNSVTGCQQCHNR